MCVSGLGSETGCLRVRLTFGVSLAFAPGRGVTGGWTQSLPVGGWDQCLEVGHDSVFLSTYSFTVTESSGVRVSGQSGVPVQSVLRLCGTSFLLGR